MQHLNNRNDGDCYRFSLVSPLEEALDQKYNLGGPEPDFFKWLESVLFADICLAHDESASEQNSPEERKAWKTFYEAVSSTQSLLELYQGNPKLFRNIAQRFSVLPCLMSRHPSSKSFNQKLFKFSQVGTNCILCEQGPNGPHYAHQSWPVRYAYAIFFAIDLSMDTWIDDLPMLAKMYGYGIPHTIPTARVEKILAGMKSLDAERREELRIKYSDAYHILPIWTKGLKNFKRPLGPETVAAYWRKGKEIMMEEIPNFHLRPEWKSYHRRSYQGGRKSGTIQHAIFRDILSAMRTIVGVRKKKAA